MSYRRWIYFLVLAAVALPFVAFSCGLPGVSTDDFIRVYMALQWWKHPQLMQAAEWPPLYTLVYGSALAFRADPLTTAHVLTALFSGVIIWLSSRIAFELTGLPLAGLLGAFLALTAPLALLISVSTLSKPMYCAVGLGCAWAVLRWLRSSDRRWLLASALLFLPLAMTRIDAWPLAFLFGFVALWRERSRWGRFAAFAVWAFPLLWLLLV